MTNTTVILAALPAVDAVQTPGFLQVAAIAGFVVFIAGLAAAVLGVGMLVNAKKGDMKKAASQSGVGLFGILWIAFGLGGSVIGLGAALLSFFVVA